MAQQEPLDGVTPSEFIAKIKEKYPQYKDIEDSILMEKMLAKYPEYKDRINFGDKTKVVEPKGVKAEIGSGELDSVSAPSTSLLGSDNKIIRISDFSTKTREKAVSNLTEKLNKEGIKEYSISDNDIVKEAENIENEDRLKGVASDINKLNIEKDTKKQRGILGNLLTNLEWGSSELGVTVAAIPKTLHGITSVLYDVAALPQNAFSKLTGVDISASSEKTLGKTKDFGNNPILDLYLEESERLKGEVDEYNKKFESTSIWKNIKDGNIGDAFELMGAGMAQSAPVSISMMAGGAATSIGKLATGSTLVLAGKERLQLEKENPNMSEAEKTLKALGLAGAETVFMSINAGTMGKAYKEIILKNGVEKGAVIFKQGLLKMYETAFKKYGGLVGALGEGTEEVATQMTQNMINGKPILEGVPDAFIQGVGSGGVYGAPMNVANAASKIKEGYEGRQVDKIVEADSNNYVTIKDAFNPMSPDKTTIDKLQIVQKKGANARLNKDLDAAVDSGEITQVEADAYKKDFLETTRALSSTRNIELSNGNRVKAVDLIREKEVLKEEIKDMDDALASGKKERVAQIDTELVAMSGAKVEETTKETTKVEPKKKTKVVTPESIEAKKKEIKERDAKEIKEVSDVDATKQATKELTQDPQGVITPEAIKQRAEEIKKEASTVEKSEADLYKQAVKELTEDVKVDLKKPEATPKKKEITEAEAYKQAVEELSKDPQGVVTPEAIAKRAKEIKEGTEDYFAELDRTKKSDPETYWSVDSVDAKTEGEVVEVEGGKGFVGKDGDIKGVFKSLTAKASRVADKILQKAVTMGGTKLDNFDNYLSKIYKRNGFRVVSRTPFNEQYAPEGWNKEKHGTPNVVAMIYDPNNEVDIEEKMFDDPETGYDEMIAYRDEVLKNKEKTKPKTTTKAEPVTAREVIVKQVENAKKALSKVAPKVNIKIYNTHAEYKAAIGDSNSRGEWNPTTNTISISLEKANGRTVAHEVVHAVLGVKIGSDKGIQRITDKFVELLSKNINDSVTKELNDFVKGYDQDVRSEEAVSELVGMLADNYTKLSKKAQGIIKDWLDAIAKKIGLKEFTDGEVIDLLNTLATKISTGEVITDTDLNSLGVSGKISGKAKKNSLIGSINLKRFPTHSNTKLRRGVALNKMVGKELSLIESDRMTGSYIEDSEGNPMFKFLGGIHFPVITGKWWASSNKAKAEQLMRACNRKRNDDGYIYTSPVLSKAGSHMSNKDMFESVWQFMKHDLKSKKSKVTKGKLIELINKALNLKSLKNKGVGKELNLRGYHSINNIIEQLDELMHNSDLMSFDQRKAFISSLLGQPIKNESRNFPTAGSMAEFSSKFEEQDTKVADEGTGNIVMVMRTKGELKSRKTPKSDEFYHNSYPFEIYSTEQVEVIFLDGAYNITEALPVLEKKDGTKFTWKEYEKKHGKVSMVQAKSQYARTASKLSMATGKVVETSGAITKRKQLTPSEAYDKSQASAKKARDQASGENKTVIDKINSFFSKAVDELVDRQASVKKALNKIGLDKAVDYMVTKSGYSAHAKNKAREVHKKVFDGLSDKRIESLEEIILHKRIIAVDKNRADRGLEPVKHQDGFNGEESAQALEGYMDKLGGTVFKDLVDRANNYFDEYQNLLKEMKDEGLISQESFELFAEVDYQPRVFLDFLEDMDGNLLLDEVDRSERVPLSDKQIKAMKTGSEGSQLMDAWYLIQKSIQSRSAAIFSNRVNKTFANEFSKVEAEVKALKEKTILTKTERTKIKNFDKVNENIKKDEVVGYTKTGKPKFKLSDDNTKGFKPLYFYEDGVQNRIWLKTEFHEKFTDTGNAYLSAEVRETVALATGTAVVKTLATGNNPLFFITNTPRDLAFVLAFSKEYNSNVIGNSIKLVKDAAKGVKDVVNNSDNYSKFLEYGGGMDYLAIQGKYKNKGFAKSVVDGVLDKRTQDKVVRNRVKRFLDKFNLASEMGIRLAVFNKGVANRLKGRDMNDLSKEEQDMIYTQAVRSARELTDFSQGGRVTKALDAGLPYLNAATQGTRAAVNNLVDRPVETMARITQITAFTVGSTIGAAMGAIAYFRDDEEDKEKTNSEVYFETLKGVSEYDLTNYFIIPLGQKDPDGNWKYLRIAKAQALSPILNTAEHYTRKTLAKNSGIEYKQDLNRTLRNTVDNNILPINLNPLEAATRVPLVDATFAWNGIDSYTGNPLSWDRGDIPSELEGIVDKRVEPLYKEMGETIGESPVRLQSVIESFITTPSTNPYIGVLYGIGNLTATNRTTKDIADDFGKDMVKAASSRLLKSASEYNEVSKMKERISKESLEIYRRHIITEDGVRTLIKDYKENKDLDKTKEGVRKLAGDNPEMVKRIVSWVGSEAKKKKLEPLVASLKFQKNKEVRALLIAERFGDMLLKENRGALTEQDRAMVNKLIDAKVFDSETIVFYKNIVSK